MITIRKSGERGQVNMGWLKAKHSFSFGHYYDPAHMGFGSLRVINEDRVQPAKGFATHAHQDMEIITYIIDGALEHKDSMANGSVIRPGDIQRMTAGTGVQHSEFNHSADAPVHLLQIWILPEQTGLTPGYEEKHFAAGDKTNRLRLVGSRDARDGSVKIHQDVDLYASLLSGGQQVEHTLGAGRRGWLQLVGGDVTVNDQALSAGDGAAIEDVERLNIVAANDAEFLLFDMG